MVEYLSFSKSAKFFENFLVNFIHYAQGMYVNLCIYKCFLDVLYILDNVLKKNWEMRPIRGRFSVNIFFAMCSKEFTCVNGSTIQSVLRELLLTANFWVFE